MHCIHCALKDRRMKTGWMIDEYIPFGDGEGMHTARTESPAEWYGLYLGIQED
jgi:hypothetical protein